jgi:hypothetical protein
MSAEEMREELMQNLDKLCRLGQVPHKFFGQPRIWVSEHDE